MKVQGVLAALLLASLPSWGAAAYDPPSLDPRICAALTDGRVSEGIGLFESIAAQGGTPSDQANYCGASLYFRAHFPDKAEGPLLRISAGYQSWSGWPTVPELLSRVNRFKATVPARVNDDLFVERRTHWNAPVLRALPAFRHVATRIFGQAVPRVRFFIFAGKPSYRRFYRPMMDADIPNSWHDGTGNLHVVLFRENPVDRPTGTIETLGNVIHEFGHAWWNTYTMTHHNQEYLRIVKPYMDEGLADYVAGMWNAKYLLTRLRNARDAAASGERPPAFADLRSHDYFYRPDRAFLNYTLSALLVRRMLGPDGGAEIPRVLDVLAATGDDLQAWRSIGKDPATEYSNLIRGIWKQRVKKTRHLHHPA